jgi:uncharacterized membrane protein YphA (DoxX/SURF4 family)
MINTSFIYAILIVIIYILSGYEKLQNITGTAKSLKSKVPFSLPFNLFILAIVLTIFLEIFGSLIIIYSTWTNEYKNLAYYSTLGLIGFTALATMLYHYPPIGSKYYSFTKNIAIIGGLFLLADKFAN